MTQQELEEIAFRRGAVQWLASGILERLWINRTGKMIAARLWKGTRPHVIWPVQEYLCREVSRHETFTVGDYLK